jgi:hypothetical protein
LKAFQNKEKSALTQTDRTPLSVNRFYCGVAGNYFQNFGLVKDPIFYYSHNKEAVSKNMADWLARAGTPTTQNSSTKSSSSSCWTAKT